MNKSAWFIIALIILSMGGVVMYTKTRGLRNNNPGNIRKSNTKWDGLATDQTDASYFVFKSPVYGIRAMAKILHTYAVKHGLNTVHGIISRWAPPSENNTASYVDDVSARLSVAPDTVINVDAQMPKLVMAIIKHENGIQPYSIAEINQGVKLAGIA